jgi:uncharacterized membrane protein required for colicin V production
MIESVIVNFIVILAVIYAALAGLNRGFVAVAGSLAALILGLALAAATYKPVGAFLQRTFNAYPSVANVVAYGLIVIVVQILALLVLRQIIGRVPREWSHSNLNRLGGAVISGLQMLVFLGIALIVITGLPVAAADKESITGATLAKPLVSLGSQFDRFISGALGGDVAQTLDLLTIDPESREVIQLGFTTSNVQIDEIDEQRMLILVNRERTSRGLNALTLNPTAREVARAHSKDMFARGYFSHVTPEGQDPFTRMKNGGVKFGAAGENLALAPTLSAAHDGLMNSPGHRANILSPDYHTVGIGIIDGGPYGLMVTQDFTD